MLLLLWFWSVELTEKKQKRNGKTYVLLHRKRAD